MTVIIQSVTRALRILDVLSAHPGGLSNRDISDKAELKVSTTHHLIGTLRTEGYVHRFDNGNYCLGQEIPRLYGDYLNTISPQTHLRDAVQTLAELSKETAYVCVWERGGAMIQAIIEGSQAVRVGGLYVGFMGSSHLRASGKVLLAHLDKHLLDVYLATADLTPLTAHSVCDVAVLRQQLTQVVERGFAIDREEFADSVSCVAAPVFSAHGKALAALTISAPTGRFIQNEDQLIAMVVRTAGNVSRMFGYKSIEKAGAEAAPG